MHLRDSMDEIEFCPECSGRVIEAIEASGFEAESNVQPEDCPCDAGCRCGCAEGAPCTCR